MKKSTVQDFMKNHPEILAKPKRKIVATGRCHRCGKRAVLIQSVNWGEEYTWYAVDDEMCNHSSAFHRDL